MATKPQVRQFAGDFRLWRIVNGAFVPVIPDEDDPQGNQPIEANAAVFTYEAGDEISVVSKRRDGKYNQPIYTDTLPGTTSLALTLLEVPTAILARVLYGEAATETVAAGSAADVAVAVESLGKPIQLPNRYLMATPAPVFKVGNDSLVEGEDYTLDRRRGQLKAIEGGKITLEDPVLATYEYPAITATRILGGATPTESFYVTADLQDRISGEQGELEVYEARLGVDGEVDWLSAEPLSPVLSGALMVPSGKPAPYVFTAYKLSA